jgi:energy-coupling factor transporter ATP-binding protein EcfA2
MTEAPLDGRIVVDNMTKVFRGKIRAVDRLSFTVEPGSVTGFLGPNGAGKTTTLRMVLGLVHPTAGHATIGGLPYHRLHNPTLVVEAALESATQLARRATTCASSARWPACRWREPTRCSSWSGCVMPHGARSAATRWGCGSASAWPPRCSETRGRSCWTNRRTGWTRRASAGCAGCFAGSLTRAAPFSSRAISSPRSRRSPTGW